jgi:hypothetical protein
MFSEERTIKHNAWVYIDKLKSESFEGWTEDETKGYLTACESIKQKVKKIQNSTRLDSMEE